MEIEKIMRNRKWILLFIVLVGCKKPYNPPVVAASNSYLVVEGVINSGSDSTIIRLSKTVNLSNNTTFSPVLSAIVTVEGDQNTSYPLASGGKGNYVSRGLNLDNAHKYRLRIKTSDNKEYLSDFVSVVNPPPIDSIGYTIQNNGLTVYANTHDPQNNTRYYRWDYQETWQIHSNYYSYFKSDGTQIQARDVINDNIYDCWQSDTSSAIILGSSEKLSQDVIAENPLTFINSSSEKLSVKYSILAKQYALTKDAFAFWTNLKKNTQQLGSIFDAQPTEISGNIHCLTNPLEPVVGYLSVGSVSSRRIFITNQQLPAWATAVAYPDCKLDTFLYKYAVPPTYKDTINQVTLYLNSKIGKPPYLVAGAIGRPGNPIPIGYTGSTPECVNCTLRGTNKQPAFWR